MTNELYHYGVLGMKWGIRRYQRYRDGQHGKEVGEAAKQKARVSASKAVSKSFNKLNRLDKKVQKREAKLAEFRNPESKKSLRFAKKQAKVSRKAGKRIAFTEFGVRSRQRNTAKYIRREGKHTKKDYKLEKRYLASKRKVDRFVKQMNDVFSTAPVSEFISSSNYELGRKYALSFMENKK